MATTPNPQQVAIAQAVADFGSKGPAALKAANSDLATQKTSAVQAAAQRAGIVNAPEAFLNQQAQAIAEPYATAATKNNAVGSALNNYMGALSGAQGNYLSSIAGDAPLRQADVNTAAQGANISQLMQMMNLKNNIEDREYTKQQRAATAQSTQDTLANQAVQRQALSDITSKYSLKPEEIANIISAGDLQTAIGALSDKDLQKDLQKRGVNVDAFRKSLIQYYDPDTYKAIAASEAAAAAQAATQPSAAAFVPMQVPSVTDGVKNNVSKANPWNPSNWKFQIGR